MDACPAWLALWNDVDREVDDEYNAWHAEEHVPQRLTVPGILAAARYRSAGPDQVRYFTWYALAGVDVVRSEPYRKLLEQPTPWSNRMRPHLRNLARYVCRDRGSTARMPGGRIRARLLRAGDIDGEALLRAAGRAMVGEADLSVPDLPWAAALPEPNVTWIRLEDVSDAFPGTYLLLNQFRSH
jgi:hypothetical protein